MASYKRSEIYNDIQELTDVRKSLEKKFPVFVPLNGLSQSEKDRRMNNRTVRPPKNIQLFERDPSDDMEFSKIRDCSFPTEYQLSSQIKESNGMDYSNHSSEQYYRNLQSTSSEISEEDSSNSLSVMNETGTFSSVLSNSTEVESSITENDVLIVSQDDNPLEDDYNLQTIDEKAKNDMIRRFSKNAAIMGLLRNKLIPATDFNKNDHQKTQFSTRNKDDIIEDKNDNNNSGDFNSETNKILAYPYLVPHPEDPEFFTHPFQAYGRVDDDGIDFTVRSRRVKTIITPRQHYIREGLNDDVFKFQTNKSITAAKSVSKFSFPSMTRQSRSPIIQNENPFGSRPTSSHSSSINQDDDKFVLNHNDFPTL